MKRFSTNTTATPSGPVGKAFEEVSASFERFCLAAGVETLSAMLEKDAEEVCGPRHARGEGRRGHRWGRTRGKIGFHGGKVELERPRVRDFDGQELPLPSWERASEEDWLGRWAMNLMLINVSTRKFRRAVRLPDGDVPAPRGAGVSKSATSRRFVALSAARMKEWIASDLGHLDIMVVQIDGIHIAEDIVLVAAIGIDSEGTKHPLGLIEGATEHSAVVQALIDNLIERLPKPLHASVRHVRRQAWELDDADKAEKLIRNLAQRLERDAPGVSASILEGLDEILTVTRLGLPAQLRRSLACTNIIENVMGTVRRVCRNVKHWRSPAMAMRWTAAAMMEAKKGFRRLKAHKHLPTLRVALNKQSAEALSTKPLAQIADAA